MGGTGMSNGNVLFINNLNPAMLQRTKYTTIDYGFDLTYRQLESNRGKGENADATLQYISMAFPVARRWTTNIGFQGVSSVNYSVNDRQPVGEYMANYSYQGQGGINKAYFSNGYRVIDDSIMNTTFSLGLEAAMMFGRIESTSQSQYELDGELMPTANAFATSSVYRGSSFKPGFSFRKEINVVMDTATRTYTRTITDSLGNKKEIEEQLTVNEKKLFYDQIADRVGANAIQGKYMLLFPGKESVKVDRTIKNPEERSRLYQRYKEFKTEGYGIYVRSSAKNVDKKELEDDFVDTYLIYSGDRKADPDATYDDRLREVKEYLKEGSGIFFNVGAAYDISSRLSTTENVQLRKLNNEGVILSEEQRDETMSDFVLAPAYHVGMSIDKTKPSGYNRKGEKRTGLWTLAMDASVRQWSTVESGEFTQNTFSLHAGGEFIPDYLQLKGSNFFSRIIYRGGLMFNTLPFEVNNTSLSEFGINFGMSVPVGPGEVNRKTPKFINMAVTLGQRGTLDNDLIRERFIKGTISMTLTDKWFTRRKIGL